MIRHEQLQANGLSFHVATAGERGRPLVLLLHGFPECWYSWRRQLVALGEKYFVVAPDMRGYGGTDKPRKIAAYQLDALAADVAGLIEALGYERAFVVGHDWGGAVAWHVASSHPERVAKLVVLNCPHPAVFMARVLGGDWAQLRRSLYMLFFQLPVLPERLFPGARLARMMRKTTVRRDTISTDDVREFEAILSTPGTVRGGLSYYRAMRLALLPSRVGELRATWRRGISAPALLVWGESDPFLGIELLEGHERFAPGLRVERIPGAGHWVQQEAADEVNRALAEFLA